MTVFHSETGTEGGYWGVQDEEFMHLPDTQDMWSCPRCNHVWTRARQPDEPKPSFVYWVEEDGSWSDFQRYDEPHDDLPTTPGEPGDSRDLWTRERNALALDCYLNGHAEWKPMFPNGTWSFDGLHILHDGDYLKIFEKDDPDTVVWEGEIDLHEFELFTQDAMGLWIHADQRDVPRNQWAAWFLKEHPCELRTTAPLPKVAPPTLVMRKKRPSTP